MTLAQVLAARAAEIPGRDLLRMPGRTLTFGDFDREVNRLANGLLAAGVRRGEMVGVMLPNCPEFALLWLAAFGDQYGYWKPVETGTSDTVPVSPNHTQMLA